MAWSAPATAGGSGTLTSAMFNGTVRDDLLASEAGIAALKYIRPDTNGIKQYFVSTAANALASRNIWSATYSDPGFTTSTSYVTAKKSGPSITATTGTVALVILSAGLSNITSGQTTFMSVAVSGATTVAVSDNWGISVDGISAGDTAGDNYVRRCAAHLFTGLTAGNNIFTANYRCTGGTALYRRREIIVIPF